MIKGYCFKGILQTSNWLCPAYVTMNQDGIIQSIGPSPSQDVSYQNINGYAVPGTVNSHSHAFQYAMVGLTEYHDASDHADDFWSWRKLMYEVALSIDPDQLENIATLLYAEMLRMGYTRVVEFHYLHHDKEGKHYDNKAELGLRLIAAAKRAGIKITLVPIFYQKGGFGKEASPNQIRFLSKTADEYQMLWESSYKATLEYRYADIGRGVHSMRAVDPLEILSLCNHISDKLPFHMHISEQLKEVDNAITYLGARPVEWVLNHLPISKEYHLVHATHMTQKETIDLAHTGAHVVLCPSTEGNLGDGLFNLKTFQQNGGHWSIGTDSHIGINPMEELRILDYGQRSKSHKRNIYNSESEGDSGSYAFNQIIKSGRAAAGTNQIGFFEIGKSFDALIIDAGHPIINTTSVPSLTSTIVYVSDPGMYLGTIVNGEWIIKDGRHLRSELINNNFISSINSLAVR